MVNLPSPKFADNFANKTYHYIDKKKFYILGEGFFIYPKDESMKQKVFIHLESSAKKIVANIKPYFYKNSIVTNLNNLPPSIILGNESFYINEPIKNTKLIIWSADEDLGKRINSIVSKVLNNHKNFWNDINFDQVAIFIPNPFKVNRNKWYGRVIDDTILAFINPQTIEDIDINNLINHENLHSWFGNNLIKGPSWFTEGFADYYMDKINYYYLENKSQFVDNYNKKLKKFSLSPLKNLNDKYYNDIKFDFHEVEKLPYLKGYLIAGQIDSVIDLDQAIRNMIKICRKDKTDCIFSPEFLFKNANDITPLKKQQISEFIKNFSINNLTSSLQKIASLKTTRTIGLKYDIDIVNIINNKTIPGNYLNKLCSKYDKNKLYNLLDLRFTQENVLTFFIENNNIMEEFVPPITHVVFKIPYYKFN